MKLYLNVTKVGEQYRSPMRIEVGDDGVFVVDLRRFDVDDHILMGRIFDDDDTTGDGGTDS